MPRAGGVYSLPSNYEATAGETATATQHNSPLEDLQTDMNTARPVVAGGTGATSASAARSNLGVDAAFDYQAKSSTYTLVAGDHNGVTRFTATSTANLTAAATLGSGWYSWIIADGGDVTVDPNASETINGSATLTVSDGNSALVVCNGTAFFAIEVKTANLALYLPLAGGTMSGTLAMADQKITRPQIEDYAETVNAIGSIGGGTQDIDLELGNVVSATVDTSTTTFTFSNPPATGKAGSFTLILTNGGSQTVNWPASVDWDNGEAPALTTSGVDILSFLTVDGGTTWYGFVGGLAFS